MCAVRLHSHFLIFEKFLFLIKGYFMPLFKSKPVVVEAILWTGYNYTESEVFTGEGLTKGKYETASPERGNGWTHGAYANSAKVVHTINGDVLCQPGDWIVKGLAGEFYPCHPEVFALKYEPA